jgi:hypothetical protein
VYVHHYRWYILNAWLFVIAVTVFDVRWALRYRETITIWEANPIMRWVVSAFGVWAAGIARLATVAFGASLMPVAPRRWQVAATVTIVVAHLYLAATYAQIVWGEELGQG